MGVEYRPYHVHIVVGILIGANSFWLVVDWPVGRLGSTYKVMMLSLYPPCYFVAICGLKEVSCIAAMSTNAHPPCCLVFWSVEVGTRKIIPCHMNQSIAVVRRFLLATDGGKI